MCITCNKCSEKPPVVKELINLIEDGDPLLILQTIVKLVAMGVRAGILTEEERMEIIEFHHLLSEIAIQRDHDKDDIIHALKIPA